MDSSDRNFVKWLMLFGGGLILLGVLITLLPFIMVQQGNMGIVLTWGKQSRTLPPGFHWLVPFADSVETMDVTEQILSVTESAYSKDSQIIAVEVTVNYQLDQAKVDQLYNNVRHEYEARLVVPPVKNVIKEVISGYTAQGVVEGRASVTSKIRESLSVAIPIESGILVRNVNVTNIDFDDEYEAVVKRKQVAEQEALAQVNITKQTEEAKKQEINRAEALAEKTRLESAALASQQGEKLIAKIYAEAALEMAKKWNGTVPSTYIGGGTDGGNGGFLSFLNLNALIKE